MNAREDHADSADELAWRVGGGEVLSPNELLWLSTRSTKYLTRAAAAVRDAQFGSVVTYSRKVFVPLTQLCRNVCHYCTFAKTPHHVVEPYMSIDSVLDVVRKGKAAGCNEALLTLGEKPELRYSVAKGWLDANGFASTIDYVGYVAGIIVRETGLLPHINAGTLTLQELKWLRPISASMGIMLETASPRLCEPGMPHYGSADKHPNERLRTLRFAGEANVPTTSGVLIGIGETASERIDALLSLRALHQEYGHIQEVILQNFRAKPGTKMSQHPEPSNEDLVRTIALARLALGPDMSLQAPPNLSPSALPDLIGAGINDWGGVSPITPDHVNPEAPWPNLDSLSISSANAGKTLVQRLAVYPAYIRMAEKWLSPTMIPAVLNLADSDNLARESSWMAGGATPPPERDLKLLASAPLRTEKVFADLRRIVEKGRAGEDLSESEICRLFQVRDLEFAYVCRAADLLRKEVIGDEVSYVVTRNITYTNVCGFGCRFCAFSKGKSHGDLRGKPYDLNQEEIARRTLEAWARGATEVCMQGGIHPDYTGKTYLDICHLVKAVCPEMHIHAFSPLEVTHGSKTLGVPVKEFLEMLKGAGLGTLPGTAAEVLHDEIRAILCPDKLSTTEWLEVIEAAHRVGLKTTSTIMFGHIDRAVHWARHLLALRALQKSTGGFTEFVPLPFVAQEAPLFRKGGSRPGPTFREAVLMHAVARIVLYPHITNIQTSWVKLGRLGTLACLNAGANDLGGTLMNESISRAAGTVHGQEAPPEQLEQWIRDAGRIPRQRNTLYGKPDAKRQAASFNAPPLLPVVNNPVRRRVRTLG